MLAQAIVVGPRKKLVVAKAGGLPRLLAPLQHAMELLGRNVDLAPEDADLRLRRRLQHLRRGSLGLVGTCLGRVDACLLIDRLCFHHVRTKVGIPELGTKGAINLLQLDLMSSMSIVDLLHHVQARGGDPLTHLLLGRVHPPVGNHCVGCLLVDALLPAPEILVADSKGCLLVSNLSFPQWEGSPVLLELELLVLEPHFMIPQLVEPFIKVPVQLRNGAKFHHNVPLPGH